MNIMAKEIFLPKENVFLVEMSKVITSFDDFPGDEFSYSSGQNKVFEINLLKS